MLHLFSEVFFRVKELLATFFFFACKISLSLSKSIHALAHLKFTFPNTNDQNKSPILAKNFTLLTRWRYRGGQTDSHLTSYVSSASGRNFSEFALRLTKYGNQAEFNKTDNHLFTNTANTFLLQEFLPFFVESSD